MHRIVASISSLSQHQDTLAHDPVAVPRFRCTGCGATCSRLPACVAPRRWYDWRVPQQALRALAERISAPSGARPWWAGRCWR